jgi:hypothetical protein
VALSYKTRGYSVENPWCGYPGPTPRQARDTK